MLTLFVLESEGGCSHCRHVGRPRNLCRYSHDQLPHGFHAREEHAGAGLPVDTGHIGQLRIRRPAGAQGVTAQDVWEQRDGQQQETEGGAGSHSDQHAVLRKRGGYGEGEGARIRKRTRDRPGTGTGTEPRTGARG